MTVRLFDLEKDFVLQCNPVGLPRRTFITSDRTERRAVVMTTLPGDNNVAGSGGMFRTDQYLGTLPGGAPVLYGEGVEQYWGHSIKLGKNFQLPNGESSVLFDFHNYPEGGSAANYMVNFVNWNSAMKDKLGWLQLQRFSGDRDHPTEHAVAVCRPVLDEWYDFVYHVGWSATSKGFFKAWVNNRLYMDHIGPTLYPNSSVYLKLAHYHVASPTLPPAETSVIHERVMLGTTYASVTQ